MGVDDQSNVPAGLSRKEDWGLDGPQGRSGRVRKFSPHRPVQRIVNRYSEYAIAANMYNTKGYQTSEKITQSLVHIFWLHFVR